MDCFVNIDNPHGKKSKDMERKMKKQIPLHVILTYSFRHFSSKNANVPVNLYLAMYI